MKKLLALLLAMLMILSVFAACKSDKDDDDDDDDDKKVNVKKDKDGDGEEDEPEDEDSCDHEFDEYGWIVDEYATCTAEGKQSAVCLLCGETVEEVIEKEPHTPGETEVKTDGYMYTYCSVCGEETDKTEAPRSYQSEYLIDEAGYYLTEAKVAGNYYDVIKDAKGANVYTFKDGESVIAYANGYFVSQKEDIVFLKKVDGEEITNTTSLGITDFGRNEIDDYLADGYLFAYSVAESFSGTEYKAGILKVDGTWLVPLSSDNPIVNCGIEVSADWLHDDIAYAGDGNAYFYVGSSEICGYNYLVYNFANNKLITYDTELISNWDLRYYVFEDIDYNDGVHRWYSGGNVYDVKDDGSITKTVIIPEGVSVYSDENNQYYTNSDGTLFFMAKKEDKIVLMNSKGTVVKDFEAAYGANITSAYHCGDGKWTLWMKNNEGTYYYTAIDITGAFKFDPIKCTDVDSVRIMSDNIGTVSSDRTIVIDFETGEELYRTASSSSDFACKNGIFYDDSAEESYFILGEEAEDEEVTDEDTAE